MKKKSFKLRSGNTTSFKMMGKSPIKQLDGAMMLGVPGYRYSDLVSHDKKGYREGVKWEVNYDATPEVTASTDKTYPWSDNAGGGIKEKFMMNFKKYVEPKLPISTSEGRGDTKKATGDSLKKLNLPTYDIAE